MNDAEIKLQVKIDESSATKSINNIEKKAESLSKSFGNIGKKMTAGLTMPIVGLGAVAVKNASDLEETINKIDVVFGESGKEIQNWGKTSIENFGMAQQTALDMVALYGDMGTAMGLNQQESADMGKEMVKRAGDMASFKNVSQEVAKTALTGIFTGETESLKKMGIVMTQANLEQYALQKGYKKRIKDMTQAEKVQLRYNYVMEQSKNAEDDFKNTSDGTANTMRTTGETFKEVTATLGKNLLPIVNKVLQALNKLMIRFNGLSEGQKKTILVILGVVAAIGPLLLIFSQLIKLIKIAKIVFAAFNLVMSLNPIGLIILGIAALIAILVLLWKKCDWFRNLVTIVFKAIIWYIKTFINNIKLLWSIVKWVINKIVYAFKVMANGIKKVFYSIKNVIYSIFKGLYNLVKKPINFLIGGLNKISFTAPSWVPKIGGKKFGVHIPKLATGTNNVQQEGLAYLHQGEAVVPKKYNPAMGGTSQGITNVYVNIEQDPLGQMVQNIKTFSGGAKNNYNYGGN